jgi:DNA repair photolyase
MPRRRTTFEAITSKSLLNLVKAPSLPFNYSINPYRGCQHGCSFCYARATHSFLGAETDDTFQHLIFIKENASEILEKQLERAFRSKGGVHKLGHIAIGTATDPYQPIEAKAMLTRACLEVLARYDVPVSITTRSPLVLRDIDLLKQFSEITVNLSINTFDENIWRSLEPATPHPMKRMETVEALNAAGIRAGVFLAPILPYLTDSYDQLKCIIEESAKHKASFVMSSFLRLSHSEVKVWFFRTLEDAFPHLIKRYAALFAGSGYVPNSYREPIKTQIAELLHLHEMLDLEAFRGRTTETTRINISNSPEQLSFTF